MPDLVAEYIKTLSEKDKIVFELAKKHLGSSFNIKKSIGYKKWFKK